MTTSTEKSYFDLHITGLGYLNRIREVKPKKGDVFLACDIAALNGPSNDVSYVRFDTRVSGSEAQHLVHRCIDAVEAEKKVMIGFRLGDLWTDIRPIQMTTSRLLRRRSVLRLRAENHHFLTAALESCRPSSILVCSRTLEPEMR